MLSARYDGDDIGPTTDEMLIACHTDEKGEPKENGKAIVSKALIQVKLRYSLYRYSDVLVGRMTPDYTALTASSIKRGAVCICCRLCIVPVTLSHRLQQRVTKAVGVENVEIGEPCKLLCTFADVNFDLGTKRVFRKFDSDDRYVNNNKIKT